MDRLLKAFVEANAKYKELFSVLYTALGSLVGIILYRERKKYKEGSDYARVTDNEEKIRSQGDKIEALEDKVSAMASSMKMCQSSRHELMRPVEARINEMEKRLLFMLETNRETAKKEKEHELEILMTKIERMVK